MGSIAKLMFLDLYVCGKRLNDSLRIGFFVVWTFIIQYRAITSTAANQLNSIR